MMALDGFCLAHRAAWDNPVFRNLLEAGIWNWMYQTCVWKDTQVRMNGCVFPLKRGQLVTTISFISKGFGLSPQSTRTFLKNLENQQMINTRTNKQATIITICNYDKFQDLNEATNKRVNKRPTNDQQTGNNNKKELNTVYTVNTPLPPNEQFGFDNFKMPDGTVLNFDQLFERWWVLYPKIRDKGSKQSAKEQLLKKLKSKIPYETIGRGIKKYRDYCDSTGEKNSDMFKWLRDDGFTREYSTTGANSQNGKFTQSGHTRVSRAKSVTPEEFAALCNPDLP